MTIRGREIRAPGLCAYKNPNKTDKKQNLGFAPSYYAYKQLPTILGFFTFGYVGNDVSCTSALYEG